MAQLKDLLVSGPSRLIGKLFANEVQLTTLNIPTSSGGTTYGPGTNNYLIKSNGTSVYWTTLAASDIPNLNASKITAGTLPVARGGTNATSFTAWGVVYASSASQLTNTAAGTSGYLLQGNGSAAPSWVAQSTIAAGTAAKLAASKTIQTNLASTSAASFDGSANVTPGVTGTLGVANGGTGRDTLTSGSVLIGNGTGQVGLRSIRNNTSTGALGWTSASTDTTLVTTNTIAYWNGAYSGTSSNISVVGTITTGTWSATTIAVNKGGTGKTSWTAGEVVYASAATTLAGTGAGTSGQFLKSGGSGAPTWANLAAGDIPNISTDKLTSGTLPIARGGTGQTSFTQWGIVYPSSATVLTSTAAGSSGYLLQGNGSAAPSWIQATNANTASTIVKRDGSGNFSAGTITAALSGNASTATKVGNSSIWFYPESSNELNIGGTNTSTTLYVGYRAKDSRPIPTKFIFGGSNGSASLQANTVYLGSGTTSYVSSTQYTGNAKTATNVKCEGITPTISKKYESTNYYATSSGSWETSTWYFMSVKPTSWYKPWTVRFKVHTYEPSYSNADSVSYCTVSGREQSFVYANWNERYDSAHYYTTIYPLKKAGFDAGYGHAIGISILYGYNYTNSAHYRTFEIDYYDCDNCEVTLLDTPVKWASWTGTGSTNYNGISSMDAVSRGLQESGDANDTTTILSYYDRITAGSSGLKQYSLAMQDSTGAWQSFTTDYGVGTSKTKNTTGFVLGDIVYLSMSGNVNNNNIVGWGAVRRFQSLIDYRYSFNCGTGLTANKMVYIVGSLGTDGLFYLADTWWTQTLPTSEDGKLYIPVGIPYPDSGPYRGDFSGWHIPLWYKDGNIIPFYNNAVRQTAVTASSYTNWRSLVWGASNSSTEGFTPTTTTDRLFTTSIFSVQPSTGTIKATTFKGALSGNATSATKANLTTSKYGIAYYSATDGTFANLAPGTAGQFLRTGGTAAVPYWGSIAATDVPNISTDKLTSGTLPVARGGTAATSFTQWGVVYASTSSALTNTAAGTSGYWLKANGSAAPTWESQANMTAGLASALTNIGSGDAASSTTTQRYVWFSYDNNTTGRPAYSSALTFQTSTGTLTATKFSGNGASITNLNMGNAASGTLAIARGGTGATSFTVGSLVYASAATTLASVGVGSSGQVLTSDGNAPTWVNQNTIYAGSASQLTTTRTINGTSFNGTANITTAFWGAARSITIKDADKTNAGTATTVNGSTNYELLLPSTIKATLTGNASTATALTSNAGTSAVPIYFSGGKPVACGSSLNVSITGNAATATNATNATHIYSGVSTSKAYVLGTLTASSANHATVYNASVYTEGSVLYGAAWNDYAEYRETSEKIEAGRVVIENGDDTMSLSTERMQPGAEIVSDTFGFAIGKTDKAKTPIAVTGRVLAYPFEDIEKFKPGQPVCSGPNGTVSIMSNEEARNYPWLIIGTVSGIPKEKEWGALKISTENRIWIRIK